MTRKRGRGRGCGGGGGGTEGRGKKGGLGPNNDVLATCKAINSRPSERFFDAAGGVRTIFAKNETHGLNKKTNCPRRVVCEICDFALLF